jgi:hypothetical protein
VNRSVTTEEQNDIDIISVRRHAKLPLYGVVSLKWLKIFGRATQPENGRSAHPRG